MSQSYSFELRASDYIYSTEKQSPISFGWPLSLRLLRQISSMAEPVVAEYHVGNLDSGVFVFLILVVVLLLLMLIVAIIYTLSMREAHAKQRDLIRNQNHPPNCHELQGATAIRERAGYVSSSPASSYFGNRSRGNRNGDYWMPGDSSPHDVPHETVDGRRPGAPRFGANRGLEEPDLENRNTAARNTGEVVR